MPSASAAGASSVLDFLTAGSVASSALRFLEGASSSSLSEESEESESESASESESEVWSVVRIC